MGDPKFSRRLYQTPFHPWKADRIQEENALEHKFGLKNKREVWRAKSHLRALRRQARGLLSRNRTGDPQAAKETTLLLAKMNRLGWLGEAATLDDVLALDVEQILTRRLQTQVYLKGYTASIDQARQFIAHGHVSIGDNRINVPGYYVQRSEEDLIQLTPGRPVADDAHPARPKRAEGAGPPRLRELVIPTFDRRGGPGGRRGGPPGRGGPGGGRGGPGGGRGGPPGRPGGYGGGPGRGPPPRGAPRREPEPASRETPAEREKKKAEPKTDTPATSGGTF